MSRIGAVATKELRQVFRDPRMRVVLFVMPAVQVFIFAYAATTDVRHIATGVLDYDRSATSRALVARLEGSGYFDVVAYPQDERAAASLLDTGEARVVLTLPAGLEADARAGKRPAAALAADGTDANAAALAVSYAARIVAAGERPLQQLEARAWYNPNLESKFFYVPGIMALVVTVITLMLTAMAVVREREIGTIEQLLVTPIRPVELLLGKTLPFAAIGFIDAALVLAVALFWFEIPLRGSVWLFFGTIAIYLVTTLSSGLLISTISRTQQQAMLGAFFFAFPAVLLSGFMFPVENMPAAIQWLTYLDPLRYLIHVMRGLFLKGLGLDALWPDLVALAGLGALALGAAVARFK